MWAGEALGNRYARTVPGQFLRKICQDSSRTVPKEDMPGQFLEERVCIYVCARDCVYLCMRKHHQVHPRAECTVLSTCTGARRSVYSTKFASECARE